MEELIQGFLRYLRVERLASPLTLHAYETDLRDLLRFLCDARDVDDLDQLDPASITLAELRPYLHYLRRYRKLSNSSLQRHQASMRSFFGYLVREGVLLDDPSRLLPLPRKNQRLPRFLEEGEMQALLDAADGTTLPGLRDRAILELLYGAGLRVAEAAALNVGGVDFQRGCAAVLGKGNKQRIEPLGPPALQALAAYLTARQQSDLPSGAGEPLFLNQRGGRLSERSFRNLLDAYMTKAALLKHISPHALRHTYATHLLNRGADIRAVQELLGHESVSTTQIYTHVSNQQLRLTYDKNHPRSGKYEADPEAEQAAAAAQPIEAEERKDKDNG